MKKWYEEHEIWFAVVSILIYVMTAGNMRSSFGEESPQNMAAMLILTSVIVLFLCRNRLLTKYGLHFWPKGKTYLSFIPFLLLGLLNLRLGIKMHYAPREQIFAVISMGLVGFLEEMIFRGFLFRAMAKENHTRALIVSAITFGAGHIINLLTGQASVQTVLQMCYAVAIGFAFVLVYDRCGSLWPCIITHSMVDITAVFANSDSADAQLADGIFVIVLCALYGWYVIRKNPNPKAQ